MRLGRHSLEVMSLVEQLVLRIDHFQDQWRIVKVVSLMTTTREPLQYTNNNHRLVMVFSVGERKLLNMELVDLTPPTRSIEKTFIV
jgi:hypothetical protein